MAISNVTPASGETLTPAASFRFEVTDPYTSLLVRVTTNGGVLEAAYDDAVAPGYTVSIEDLGATHRVTVSRDAGWSDDPMTVYVTENGTTTSSWTYDIFPTQAYPEGMRPYNDSAEGATEGVLTFEGRSGNVFAEAGDYTSDDVPNDSTVTGATVSDALEQLDADIGAIPSSPVTSVHGRTGAVVAVKDDYQASQVGLLSISGFDTVQGLINQHVGVGIITGGEITDNGDGTVAVGVGSGMLRALDIDTGDVYSIQWDGVNPLVLVDNELNYIYVEYNAGTPQVATSTTLPTDLNTNLLLAGVHRSGTVLHPTPFRYQQNNLAFLVNRRHYNVEGTTHSSGSAISEVGTRNVRVETGTFYLGMNQATFAAHDTSGADTATYYYRDGLGGWTGVYPSPQIDNLQYDDGSGTLATLGTGRYGVHWVYISPHDQHMYFVYGQGNYTKSQAQQAVAPGSLPPQIDNWHAVLAGKIIVLKSAATFLSVESAFQKLFLSGGVDSHGDLTGLTGTDDHTQYALTDGTRAQPFITVDGTTPATPGASEGRYYANDSEGASAPKFKKDNGVGSNILHTGNVTEGGRIPFYTQTTTGGQIDHDTNLGYYEPGDVLYLNGVGAMVRMGEASTPGNIVNAGQGGYWVKNSIPTTPGFTDDTDADHILAYVGHTHVEADVTDLDKYTQAEADALLAAKVAGPASATDTELALFDGATGKLIQGTGGYIRAGSAGNLYTGYGGSDPLVGIQERASGPSSSGGYSRYWTRNDIPTQAMVTNDTGEEAALVQRPGFRFEYDSTTSGTGISTGLVRFNNATVSSATTFWLYYGDKDGNSGAYNWFRNAEPGCMIRLVREDDPTQSLVTLVISVDDAQIGEGPSYAAYSLSGNNVSTNWTNPSDGDIFYVELLPAQAERESLAIEERTALDAETNQSGRGWLWNGNIYEEHAGKKDSAQDAPSPTWTDADGNETNLSWLSRNYAKTLGLRMAMHSSGERDIYAVGGTPATGDGAIGFLCDDFSGHFYRTAYDSSLADYIAGDSADGYTWAFTTIDSSTTAYDMARPVSNGQFVATACDSLVYLSTDLTLGNLVYKSSVPTATESSNMFWHEGSQLWVHVGYSGATGYIHTSPDCVTWTQRFTRASRTWICGDIVTVPWWSQSHGVVSGQNERICLWNNGTSEMVYSDNATSWFVDTGNQPTVGLISVCWCPQMGSEDSKDFGGGCWWGMDNAGAIWHTIGYGAGTWYAATYTGYQLLNAKGDFCGWGNRVSGSGSQTIYQHSKVGDQGANDIMYDNIVTLREALTMYWQSSSTTHYAQYAWGNGVILWASNDYELVVGRYGPTRKSSSGPYA